MQKIKFFGFGSFVGLIDGIFGGIWKVISRLSLHPLLTVGAVWLILSRFLPEEKTSGSFNTVFIVLACVCVFYAVCATIYNVARYIKNAKSTKKNKKRSKEISMEDVAQAIGSDDPVYYRVAQNPRYVVAEYKDRNELYYDDDGELKFVKMTLKNNEENK